ncbi:MAG: transcriptional regulator [Comamonadaceae bacterium PBBC1]|nr:MAG: transcriptional regulator [Comamonadaceae bacterium PBBC1]
MGCGGDFSYDLNHMNNSATDMPADPRLLALLPPAIVDDCELRRMRKGERLFAKGQRPRHLFWVHTGQVVLERAAANGTSVVLQRTHQGFVSEASLQSPHYHCDAVVVVDARITCVPMPALLQALTDDAAFALRWIAMLNQEVRRLRLQCERLNLKGVQARLLHWLETEGTGGCCSVTAGYKSLAAELGVSHEALYRALADMAAAGLVLREPDRLCLNTKSPFP